MAVMCGGLVGWSIRHIPIGAIIAGTAVGAIVIVCAEAVRRRVNRDRAIEAEWRSVADDWRRRHL